jgi:hypothetical protein
VVQPILEHADLALLSDPVATRVVLRRPTGQAKTVTGEGTYVRFEGRTRPTSARGEGLANVWQIELVFARSEHAEALAVEALLETAFTAADDRLVLRTRLGTVEGLDPVQVVSVHAWQPTPQAGGVRRLSFEATEVDWSEEV